MKADVVLNLFSKNAHTAQIITGFLMLKEQGIIDLKINNIIGSNNYKYANISLLEAYINGKRVLFDTEDGYWEYEPGGMEYWLGEVDYYFKRSYSSDYNKQFSDTDIKKIHKLGFNYYVTYPNNPIKYGDKYMKKNLVHYIKRAMGLKLDKYFVPSVFEFEPNIVKGDPKILFYVGLYEPNLGVKEKDEERKYINDTRIKLVKELKKEFGKNFSGGIQGNDYARRYCPELVLSKFKTERSKFQKEIIKSDICIGTMGLHESIGWKTAQYIASSRGIVNEKLHYEVTGDFEEEKNYLSFTGVEDCMESVYRLYDNKEQLYNMKNRNHNYYEKYLRPDQLVLNAIKKIVNY